MNKELAIAIREKALSLGYESSGILSISDMQGYAEKLKERIERFPELKSNFEGFYDFAFLNKKYPWAKSVVICVRNYGKYRIPEHLHGLIAKYYLVDSRRDKNSTDYEASINFERFLSEQGIKCETNREFGITSLRWAAMEAGLGIIRNNNFFYTEKGSWMYLEAWLIDKELELKEVSNLKKCSDSCNLCIKACPTKSLESPYTMNRSSCVSCINTWDGRDMPKEKYKKELGNWVFGCDACQDACPYNKEKWTNNEEFPNLAELGESISLEKILEMDYDYLRDIMRPKFWYIPKADVWKWKANAINAMLNSGEERYHKYIEKSCYDEHAKVREMAQWAKKQLNNQ